jgi:hypothetical protein
MSTSDNVFLAADGSAEEVAGWLVTVLELEPVADPQLKPEQRLFRTAARTVDAALGVVVGPNTFGEVNPEPDEVQALDRYPIDVNVRLVGRKDEALQLRETRAIFERLTAERPDVPVLLIHNLDTLVAAHLPGAGTHFFVPPISPDADDLDVWRPWVRS